MTLFDDLSDYFNTHINSEHLKYLLSRGVSEESIETFGIGMLPGKLNKLFSLFDPVELRESGFIFNATRSRFSNHTLLFPIKDFRSSVIAFTGRTLLSETERKELGISKYTHTPYEKTKNLYNLDLAIPHMRSLDYVFVVEGQLDVILAYQRGVKNIVAVGNSALSSNHLLSISKYCTKIIVLFDNDEAGASGVAKLSQYSKWAYGIDLYYDFLPRKYHDMGEFIIENDKDSLLQHVKKTIKKVG